MLEARNDWRRMRARRYGVPYYCRMEAGRICFHIRPKLVASSARPCCVRYASNLGTVDGYFGASGEGPCMQAADAPTQARASAAAPVEHRGAWSRPRARPEGESASHNLDSMLPTHNIIKGIITAVWQRTGVLGAQRQACHVRGNTGNAVSPRYHSQGN